MKYPKSKWPTPALVIVLVVILAGISSCSEESPDPLTGFVEFNGTKSELTKGTATTTNQGVELLIEGGETSVVLWVPATSDGKCDILSPFNSWRQTSGAVATATINNGDGTYYAIEGEVELTKEGNSAFGTFNFQAKTATGASVYSVSGEWSKLEFFSISPTTCLLLNFRDDFRNENDFEYSQNGQLIHVTGYDSGSHVFDKYITYKDERPIQILSKEGEYLFYVDSIVYQNDRISNVYKHQQDYLYVYTFSYQTSNRVSSINMKQYFLDELVDEWTHEIVYDANGNQLIDNGVASFDSKRNPMNLLQQSLGDFSALPWLIPSDWHMGLWNVNGPNNVVSIVRDGIEYPYSYVYDVQNFPTRITNNIGTTHLEYGSCP